MHTITIEITPKEKNDIVQALRTAADVKDKNNGSVESVEGDVIGSKIRRVVA
jgi:hypothetical protein